MSRLLHTQVVVLRSELNQLRGVVERLLSNPRVLAAVAGTDQQQEHQQQEQQQQEQRQEQRQGQLQLGSEGGGEKNAFG